VPLENGIKVEVVASPAELRDRVRELRAERGVEGHVVFYENVQASLVGFTVVGGRLHRSVRVVIPKSAIVGPAGADLADWIERAQGRAEGVV
jgi:hypothetical protein